MKLPVYRSSTSLAFIAALVACAAPPPVVESKPAQPATTVVLLPDADGVVGAVVVKTGAGDSRLVDQAYHSVSIMKDSANLSESRQLDATQLNRTYAELLKAEPSHPVRFMLYFGVGAELLPASQAALAQVVSTIRERAPTEVSVIGHTDTTGTDDINAKLARDRAITIEKVLKGRMPSLDRITVRGFGSRDLLVPTGPNVTEPRNRRVEVVVL